jgi:pilus assembly protein CpaF
MEKVSLNFGPLDPLLRDETVTEIMVNRFDKVFLERDGKLLESPHVFPDETLLLDLIRAIAAASGREISYTHPFMDSYLQDGSRVNATLPPMAPQGATLTIRKFRKSPFRMQDFVRLGTLTDKAA